MDSILRFLIDFGIDFIKLMEIPLIEYQGITITWLQMVIACFIIPIIFSFFKVSFAEFNNDTGLGLKNDIRYLARQERIKKYSLPKNYKSKRYSKSELKEMDKIFSYDWLNDDF